MGNRLRDCNMAFLHDVISSFSSRLGDQQESVGPGGGGPGGSAGEQEVAAARDCATSCKESSFFLLKSWRWQQTQPFIASCDRDLGALDISRRKAGKRRQSGWTSSCWGYKAGSFPHTYFSLFK